MEVRRHTRDSDTWAGVLAALLLLCVMAELASFAKGDIVITAGIGLQFSVHCWSFNLNQQIVRDYGTWDMSQSGMNRMGISVSTLAPDIVINCRFISNRPDKCGPIFEEFPIFPQSMAMINCAPFDCTWKVLLDGFYYTARTGQPVRKFQWLCGSLDRGLLHSGPYYGKTEISIFRLKEGTPEKTSGI